MLRETYVSFETAKLAKEKGFNDVCRRWYTLDEDRELFEPISPADYNDERTFVGTISAPTQEMLAKWLRDNYDLHLEITCQKQLEGFVRAFDVNIVDFKTEIDHPEIAWGTSYEDAMENGLYGALKMVGS